MQEAPATTSHLETDKCAGLDCGKPASSLSCPTCLKLGITTSKFCDQDCFKRNWATHKAVHAKAQAPVTVNGVEGELSVRSGLLARGKPDETDIASMQTAH